MTSSTQLSSHTASASRTEMAFVTDNLPDFQQLVAGLRSGVQVVVLDSTRDALAQMVQALQGQTDLAAIHLLSHGAAGRIDLGALTLTPDNLNDYQAQLAQIGASLAADGDLLVYGCSVGANGAFVAQLASLTQADVAASDDLTGASALGGNWVLEISTGQIEAKAALTNAAMQGYDHTMLALLYVDSSLDSGDDSTFTNLNTDKTDGNGLSLREAMKWTSSGGKIYLDNLSTGTTITLSGSTATLANATILYQSTTGTVLTIAGADGGGVVLDSGTRSVSVASGSTLNISAEISSVGSIKKIGPGTLNFSGTNTYVGTTTISAGTLVAANAAALGTTAGATSVSSGATLAVQGDITVAEAISLNGVGVSSGGALVNISGTNTLSGAMTLAGNTTVSTTADSLTLSGVVSGAFNLAKEGVGNLVLSGINTYTGTTTISAGELAVSNGAAIDNGSAVSVASGAKLTLVHSETIGSLAGAGDVVLRANTLTAGGDGTSTTFSGVASGTGSLTKTGSGTLTLSGTNTYTGTTTISAGELAVSGGAAIADTSAVTVASGAKLTLGVNETIGSLAGAGNVVLGASTLTAGGNNTSTTFSGVITGSGTLVKTGSGTLGLLGASRGQEGSTTINGGQVKIDNITSIGAGTLTMAGGYLWIRIQAGTTTFNNTIVISADSIFDSNSQVTDPHVTLAGSISGAGKLTKTGPDTLTLSGANTHTGAVQVNQGKLVVAGGSAIGNTSAVTLGSNTTLELSSNETIGSLISGSFDPNDGDIITVSLGSNTLTTGGDATSTAFAGTITGTGGLVKTGGGTFTLSGANTYTGATSIYAGDLTVSGGAAIANTSAVTVASGATLTLVNNDSTPITFSGVASGTGSLVKAGTGELILSGANTYTGTTTVLGGELNIASHNNISSGNVLLDGGMLSLTGESGTGSGINDLSGGVGTDADFFANNIAIGANGGNLFASGPQWILMGALTGSGPLTKSGGGYLMINGTGADNASGFSGNITVSSSAIGAYGNNTLGTGQLTLTSDTIVYIGGNSKTLPNNIVLAGNASLQTDAQDIYLSGQPGFAANAVATLSGVISESGSPRVLTLKNYSATNAFILSGSNTYTGGTVLNENTKVFVSADANLGVGGSVTLQAGSVLSVTADATFNHVMVLAGAATVEVGSDLAATFSGVVSGGYNLSKAGTGVLTLSGTNTYSGTTAVNAGTLWVDGALSGAGAVSVASGATLDGSGSIAGAVTASAGSTVSGGTTTTAGSLTLNGGLALAGSLSEQIGGTSAGSFDKLVVNGAVTLTNATLDASFIGGFSSATGNSFTLIDNDLTDLVSGTFTGLAEGATFTSGGRTLKISYVGGDGNDVVLTDVTPNNAPTISGVPVISQAVTPGTAAALADFTVADADGAGVILNVTLNATNGTINGLVDTQLGTPGIQLSGTAAALNTALAAATFTATAAGAASIGISLDDGIAAPVVATYSLTASNAPAPVDTPDPVPTPVPNPTPPPVSSTIEDAAPGLIPANGTSAVTGDGNGDGIPDSQQVGVASLSVLNTPTAQSAPTGASSVYVSLVAGSVDGKVSPDSTHNAQITNLVQQDAPAALPVEFKMPLGLFSFSVDLQPNVDNTPVTETFSLYVDASIGANGYWVQNANHVWCNLASEAYGGQVVMEGGKLRLDFKLVDGGEFDTDGLANGSVSNVGAAASMPLSLVGFSPAVPSGLDFWF